MSKNRVFRERYTKDSYGRAIRRACEAAEIPRWTPNQLRHSRATAIREQFGIEAAMVVLGHSDAGTTEIYAARNFEMAERIMRQSDSQSRDAYDELDRNCCLSRPGGE